MENTINMISQSIILFCATSVVIHLSLVFFLLKINSKRMEVKNEQ